MYNQTMDLRTIKMLKKKTGGAWSVTPWSTTGMATTGAGHVHRVVEQSSTMRIARRSGSSTTAPGCTSPLVPLNQTVKPLHPDHRGGRQKKTATGGGAPDGPGDGGDSYKPGESEAPTDDPFIIPDDALDHEELPARTTPTQEPAAGFSVDTLTTAIKKAKKDGDDESWTSLKGPQRGVRFRGGTPPAPPQWKYQSGDIRAFDRFERKVNVWALQVKNYMTAAEAGLQLYVSLQGEAEMELEHVDVNCIYHKEGVKYILGELRSAFQQKSVYVKRHYLHEFETIARLPQESMRSFVNRYRRVEVSLKAIGVDMALSYDSKSRGSRLLDRAKLSLDQQRMVLVGGHWTAA